MVTHPLLGVATATIILAIFLCCEGVVEIAFYFHIRRARHAVWVLFDGIVTLILGYLIWANWPSNSASVLGTLIGISLMPLAIFKNTQNCVLAFGLSPTIPLPKCRMIRHNSRRAAF